LRIGQQLFWGEFAGNASSQTGCPLAINLRGAHGFSFRRRRPGNGAKSATMNVTTIKMMTNKLATLIWMMCQCT
jgi:hypothetical protein